MMNKRTTLFFICVFILNILWEFSHYRLYNDLSAITGNMHLILASLTDVVWVGLVYFFVGVFIRNLNWIDKPSRKSYLLFIIGALLLASMVEIVNLNLGRWSYTESMPVIFGIGISPLLQLAVTGALSVFISKRFK